MTDTDLDRLVQIAEAATRRAEIALTDEEWTRISIEFDTAFNPTVALRLLQEVKRLRGALQLAMGHSNCYCPKCKELTAYWTPAPATDEPRQDYSPDDCTTLEAHWFNLGYAKAMATGGAR